MSAREQMLKILHDAINEVMALDEDDMDVINFFDQDYMQVLPMVNEDDPPRHMFNGRRIIHAEWFNLREKEKFDHVANERLKWQQV